MRPSTVITAATCYRAFAACVCPSPILAVLFIYLLNASATTTESLRAVSPGVLWMDVLQERLSSATRLASTRVKFTAAQSPPTLSNQFFPGLPPVRYCSVLFFSRPRSEGWPHHGRTFSIHPCPVILIDSSTESSVRVLMLSIQAVRGLPRLRAPGIVPFIVSFSTQLARVRY